MDPALVAYFDRRFDELRHQLRSDLGQELRTGIRRELQTGLAEFRVELRQAIDAGAAETRRHFAVIADDLRGQIQTVVEGVTLVNKRVDRLSSSADQRFDRVDRRLLRVEARLSMLARRRRN